MNRAEALKIIEELLSKLSEKECTDKELLTDVRHVRNNLAHLGHFDSDEIIRIVDKVKEYLEK